MDFDLSEEQRLLKDSVDGLLANSYDFEQRKKYAAEKDGWSRQVWSKLAEQGLLGLPFSEDDGGFGAGAVETALVMESLGRSLVLEPYLTTVVIGGGFLRHGASAEPEGRAHSIDHRRQQDAGVRANREEFALQSRGCLDHRQEEG